MRKRLALLPLLLVFLITPIAGLAQYREGEIVIAGKPGAQLDQYMTRLARFGFSGALLVAKDGKVILHKGYGRADFARGIPITSETVFDVASLTKQFTAAAILKLEMQNRLKTGDRISKFLPNVPKDKAGITLHHLLTHTSGLPTDYMLGTNLSREQFVAGILRAPLAARPGQKYLYSNAGYTLLAAIIENVAGQSYEPFLTEQLFSPAGMSNTGFYHDTCKWPPALVAHGYHESIDHGSPQRRRPDYKYLGAYCVLASVGDLYKWELALRRNTVLSAAAKRKLFTAHAATGEPGVSYGYGWKIETTNRRTTLISHGGVHPDGFNCLYLYYPNEDLVVIAVSNKIFGGFLPMAVLQNELPAMLLGSPSAMPPEFAEIDAGLLQKYAGVYELPSGASFEVMAEHGGLEIAAEGQEAIDMLVSASYRKRHAHADFNVRSAAILDKAGRGDFSPFIEEWQERLAPAKIKTFFRQLWAKMEESYGAFQSFEILGTAPAIWAPMTYVRLNFARASSIHRLQWKPGAFALLPGSLPLLHTLFAPQSATEFAGFHPGIGKLIDASFTLNGYGEVSGLTLQNGERTVFARKKHDTSKEPWPVVISVLNRQAEFGF